MNVNLAVESYVANANTVRGALVVRTIWANILVEPSYFLFTIGGGLMQISSKSGIE